MMKHRWFFPVSASFLLAMNTVFAVQTENGDVFVNAFGIQVIGNSAFGSVAFSDAAKGSIPYSILGIAPGVEGALSVSNDSHLTLSPVPYESVPAGTPILDAAILLGIEGTGTLDVFDGSVVDGVGFVGLGAMAGSLGEITVRAGSELNISRFIPVPFVNVGFGGGVIPENMQGSMIIGGAGRGTVSVESGSKINLIQVPGTQVNPAYGLGVSLGGGPLGVEGGDGTLNVTGLGSELNILGDSGALIIGNSNGVEGGTGHVSVTGGGKITISGGAGTFEFTAIGSFPNTDGSLIVVGTNSTVIGGDTIAIGINATQVDSDPTNDVAAGHGFVSLDNGGRLESTLGTYVGNGYIRGNGTVAGGLHIYGNGTLIPGHSAGELRIIGDLDASNTTRDIAPLIGSVIAIDIYDLETFDRILATGDFLFGELEIVFVFGGFEGFDVDPKIITDLDIGDFFQKIQSEDDTEPTAGTMGTNLFGLDSVKFLGLSLGTNAPYGVVFDIEHNPSTGFQIIAAPVPLPPAILLLASGISLVSVRRRL